MSNRPMSFHSPTTRNAIRRRDGWGRTAHQYSGTRSPARNCCTLALLRVGYMTSTRRRHLANFSDRAQDESFSRGQKPIVGDKGSFLSGVRSVFLSELECFQARFIHKVRK